MFSDWRRRNAVVAAHLSGYIQRHGGPPGLTVITAQEALFGIWKEELKYRRDERYRQRREDLTTLLENLSIVSFDLRAATLAAEIFARLGRRRSGQHKNDIYIAATALSHGYGVATRNRKDFELIGTTLPDETLRLAIWSDVL